MRILAYCLFFAFVVTAATPTCFGYNDPLHGALNYLKLLSCLEDVTEKSDQCVIGCRRNPFLACEESCYEEQERAYYECEDQFKTSIEISEENDPRGFLL